MDQVEFLRSDQAFHRLNRKFAEIWPCQWRAFDQLVQRLAIDQLHHHVGAVFVRSHVVNRHDVWVLQRGQCACFLDELAGGLLHEVRVIVRHGNPFDRDLAVHPRVISSIDSTKAALAYFSADFVTFFHDVVRGKL